MFSLRLILASYANALFDYLVDLLNKCGVVYASGSPEDGILYN